MRNRAIEILVVSATAASLHFTMHGAGVAPRLAAYPCQTVIQDRAFVAPPPVLLTGTAPVRWSLKVSDFFTSSPTGLVVAAELGELRWAVPVEGSYMLSICASNQYGVDSVEWILNVVQPLVTNAVLFSTRYLDFIVPETNATWMEQWHPQVNLDASFEYMLDLFGHHFWWPIAAKQVIRFDAGTGGVAHSGNPVDAGPSFWSTDPVVGWTLGAWAHEVAHNFLGPQSAVNHLMTDNWAGDIFHGFTEFVTVPLSRRVLENPGRFGLAGQALENYRGFVRGYTAFGDAEMDRRYQPYVQWLANGGRAMGYTYDPSIVWAKICRVLADEYGPAAIEMSLRALRDDGLPSSLYRTADTALKKNTLLFCVMSCAAGTNLLARFDAWGFDADQAYFSTIFPSVNQVIATLPDEDHSGWKLCPINGHYYRLTPWMTGWPEAERMAQQMGGHLTTIRSASENEWLFSRFLHWGLWIGLNDLAHEGVWVWSSGEPVSFKRWVSGAPSGGTLANYGMMNYPHSDTFNEWYSTGPTFTWGIVEASAPAPDHSLAPQLHVSSTELSPVGTAVRVTWSSFGGQHYTLQTSASLDSEFTDLQRGLRATPPYNTVTNLLDSDACFFRVILE